MKKFFISLIFIFSILLSINVSAYNLDVLKSEGIVVGDEGGFREDDNVSRGEFIKMIKTTRREALLFFIKTIANST